jgi:hypothetical protein
MTLYDRLTKKAAAGLEAVKAEYPYAYRRIVEDLSNADHLYILPFGTVEKLTLYLDKKLVDIYDLFERAK